MNNEDINRPSQLLYEMRKTNFHDFITRSNNNNNNNNHSIPPKANTNTNCENALKLRLFTEPLKNYYNSNYTNQNNSNNNMAFPNDETNHSSIAQNLKNEQMYIINNIPLPISNSESVEKREIEDKEGCINNSSSLNIPYENNSICGINNINTNVENMLKDNRTIQINKNRISCENRCGYETRNYENRNSAKMESISNSMIYDVLLNNAKNSMSTGNTMKMNLNLKNEKENPALAYNAPLDMSYIYTKYDKEGLLYCRRIKFYVKNSKNNQCICFLIIKINSLKDSSGNPYIRLELSDDKNEFFFYYLNLYEDNYEKIKKEQKLVINFHSFPFKFIDLLEECIVDNDPYGSIDEQRLNAVLLIENDRKKFETENRNISEQRNSNYYDKNTNYNCDQDMAEKENDIAILNLVETNQFKELTHLSLILKKGDHKNIIKYLSLNLKYIKKHIEEITKKLKEEIISNNKNNHEIKSLENVIEKLETKIRTMKGDFNNTLCNDINSLKEKHLNEMINLKDEHTKLIEQKEQKFHSQNEELKKELEALKNKLKNLNELYDTNEKKQFNLNSELNFLKSELEEKNTKYMKLMKEKETVENEKTELEKFKTSMSVKYNALKDKYEKECESNISNSSSFENIKLSNSTLESDLKKYKERNVKLEKEINIAIEEINKGNDIITKLQNQLKKMKDKLKSKILEFNVVEKKNTQNEAEIGTLKNEVANLQTKLSEKNKIEEDLRRQLESLKQKNEEIIKDLNISREVNLRLNKEITNKNLDQYVARVGNLGTDHITSGERNFFSGTDLLDKDLFNKLKANIKNPSLPTYSSNSNMNNLNLITGKIASLDINDRYDKPVKFIPPNI